MVIVQWKSNDNDNAASLNKEKSFASKKNNLCLSSNESALGYPLKNIIKIRKMKILQITKLQEMSQVYMM